MLIPRYLKLALTISILILAGSLASCGGGATPVSPNIVPDLTGQEWMLTAINDKPVAGGSHVTLVFNETDNVLGSTGCNIYAGRYVLGEGNALNFKQKVTTSWKCEEPYFAQEKAMLLVLSSSSKYIIESDELKITDPDGELRATFKKVEPLLLEGTDWNLEAVNNNQGVFVNVIPGTQITASFGDDNNLSGSGGCNNYGTTYTANLSNISIGAIMSTKLACPEPEGLMDQENKYLTALEQAATYRNYRIALVLFDAEGQDLAYFVSTEIAILR